MSDEKVEVRVEDRSVEVSPRFYRVALGVLSIGLPMAGVHHCEGQDFFTLVFTDPDHLEHMSSFLIIHGLFPDESGVPAVDGGFHMEMEGEDLIPTYFLEVPEDQMSALETCLMSHVPDGAGIPN